ncbi:MAG: flagellar hook protein FlgE [Proteobacteria bacterium]|jgi:flagellar hook protein FlgE|nr:flagellar hook protein FlgE [Alphaproteobacteria bacterium]NCC04007.1 flagellar hook protein FlgE [Pseudomonadota bacterium]
MSLYAAMQVAVGGLSAQSASIGNISDNLANSQTVGFKGIQTRFESLVTQSNQFANDPGGVRATPYYTNSEQGNLVQSSSATALAISGQGFFPVRPAVVGGDGLTTFGNTTFFTRAGDFNLDKNGYLVNGGGYYLTGYAVDADGVVDTSASDPIRLSELLDNPVGTSSVDYAANLPSSAAVNFASSPSTIQVYDSLGGAHDMTFTWTKTATSEWALNIVVPDGVSDGATPPTYSDYNVDIDFTFNDTTNAGTIDAIAADTAVPAQWTVIDNSTAPENKAQVRFNLSFDGSGTQPITIDFGTYDVSKGVTQFADTTVSVTTFDQNGIPRGSFQSLSIDESGYVALNYDNGRTRTIAQIPVVQFFAQDKLQRVTGGAFEQTLASGSARYSAPGTNGAGTIIGNALEGSNVDIADEFTRLIQAQQVYSANAKTITTTNNMMQEAINIIR